MREKIKTIKFSFKFLLCKTLSIKGYLKNCNTVKFIGAFVYVTFGLSLME